MNQCLHIKVEGNVFKTGYRYFLKQKAAQLNIYGRVYYFPDHSVGVIATGPKPGLVEFLKYCLSGNMGSEVVHLDSKLSETSNFSTFEVIEATEYGTEGLHVK